MKQSDRGQKDEKRGQQKIQPIVIQLNSALANAGGPDQPLDEEFVKAIQHEYAVRCLEQMGLGATQANIDCVLE